MTRNGVPHLLAILVLFSAGCGGGPVRSVPSDTPPTATVTARVSEATPTTARGSPTATPSGLLALALTDVRSGGLFSLGEFNGKVTIAQHMAVW